MWLRPGEYSTGRNRVAVADDTVYVSRGLLAAVGASTGEQRWRFEDDRGLLFSWRVGPVVADGTVYVGGLRDDLYAISPADEESVWHVEFGGGLLKEPATEPAVVDGELAFDERVGSTRTHGRVRSTRRHRATGQSTQG